MSDLALLLVEDFGANVSIMNYVSALTIFRTTSIDYLRLYLNSHLISSPTNHLTTFHSITRLMFYCCTQDNPPKSSLELALEGGETMRNIVVAMIFKTLPFSTVEPYERISGNDGSTWFHLVDCGKPTSNSERRFIVGLILARIKLELARLLAHFADENGRTAMIITDNETKKVFKRRLFFCGRYDINMKEAAIHMSETSIILRAQEDDTTGGGSGVSRRVVIKFMINEVSEWVAE